MISIAGYKVLKLIYESSNSLIYKGYQEESNQPVILKVLKQEYPNPAELTRYKQEYEITRSLAIEGTIKAYDLQKYKNTLVIILEDFGGESLEYWMEEHQFTLEEFLNLAIKITDILGQIHAKNIIHKDINPENIVFNSDTGECKIIDFGISTIFSQENPTIKNPEVLSGTLAYMSPEQTGRMNRPLDYRTDFYSLGVTFYKLLTRQLPFQTKDALELVHAHLARQPISPATFGCPKIVADITMKLMAKTAEERYQTARGIKADFVECLQQLKNNGEIKEFTLGRYDLTNQFQIPQKLYGREKEVDTLMEAFGRVIQGKTEMILVSGYSGIGKSSLVQEIYKPITRQKGYFISGKFDQFQRNIPYSAIVNAFSELIEHIFTESKSKLENWRAKLLAALGTNGQVIIDVIPKLELIIGQQPAVPELSASESQNRFNLIFRKFLHVFCQQEHPLVIFLDDLQWADSATLKLIELMVKDEETKYLFLVGAYRDNEVNQAHPLMISLENIIADNININNINLTPFTIDDTCNLITDTVKSNYSQVKTLADLILKKTQGNPFFVNHFLKNLYDQNLINFNQENTQWEWNIEEITALDITDNVIDLMIGKLQNLLENTQKTLQIAACIGNRFSLNTLAFVQEKSLAETFQHLLPVLQQGLIVPISELKLNGEEIIDSQLVILNFKFLHDRVQQAADALIDKASKSAVHLQIGRLMLKNTPENELSEYIFEIIDHLNLGIELITQPSEKNQLAQLNLIAGLKAKLATAYQAAKVYFNFGINCLSENAWEMQRELTFSLYRNQAEVEYLIGNFEKSQEIIYQVLPRTKSSLEKADLYNLLVIQYSMVSHHSKAIEIGREALRLFGINLPSADLELALEQELIQTKNYLHNRNIDTLLDAPEMVDEENKLVIKLLNYLVPPTYQSCQPLFFIVTTIAVNLSLQYGFVAESAYMFACYGIMQCSIFQNYKLAYEFCDVAVKLSDKFNNLVQKTLTLEVMSGHISHWRQPLYLSHALTQEAYHAGLDCGEYQFASYTLLYQSYNRFYQGYNLQKYLEELNSYLAFSRKVKNQPAIDAIIGCQLILANLMQVNNFQNNKDEIEHFEDCKRRKITLFICPYLVLKSQVEYLFNRPQSALKYVLEAKNILADIPGVISVGEHNFYYSLILAAVYSKVTKSEQEAYLIQINENQKKMRLMAEDSPENFLHKYLLVEAELARIFGNLEAMELYDKAIFEARENGFVQNEALASELAAKFWLVKNKEDFAQIYLRKAHHCYQIWGATRKVEDLEAQYPDLLAVAKAKNPQQNITLTTSYTSTNKAALDLGTLLKTAQAISSEIVLEKLLASLMRILIENAGAETGFILFVEGEKLQIAASASVNYEQVTVFPKTSVESFQYLPQTVINFVYSLQQDVILDNAASSEKFTNDPYIISRHLKSLLCIPIINQGKLISLLYLENNLITGAFTPERVEVLKLLSAQAAIAIENALLYSSVEQKVWERTQELNEKKLHLEETLAQLQSTQTQLIQSEKMSSLGQLVAGVAHEINNPTSFIYSNIEPATQYIDDLLRIIRLYQKYFPQPVAEIQTEVDSIDLDFVMGDLPKLLNSMKVGADRIRTIVRSLRNFSRMDEAELKVVNIHEGIDSTLLILGHRFQQQTDCPQIKIIKQYGDLPLLECYAGQLNQVFMSILVNAIDALEDANIPKPTICISTQKVDENIVIKISDNGPGIPDNVQQRLFDPFFTTKEVGKGTGMGLSISYQIVTQHHGGSLKCFSTLGNGAEFVIEIPIKTHIPHPRRHQQR